MATKILFAPKQSDAVLDIARSLTPPGFELRDRRVRHARVLRGGRRRPSTIWAWPARWAASSSAPRPSSSWCSSSSAGYDRVDIEAARKAKVPVSNNGGANAIAVAEHTLMLMLAVLKRRRALPQRRGGGQVAGGGLRRPARLRAVGPDRRHRRASATSARRSRGAPPAFDMTRAVLRHRAPHRGRGGRPRRPLRAAAPSCCARSDVVSLHVPLDDSTAAPDRRRAARPDEAGRDPRQHLPRARGGRGRALHRAHSGPGSPRPGSTCWWTSRPPRTTRSSPYPT